MVTLRPHQKKALNAMLASDKGQVIIPTGGGKTMCMIYDSVENQKYIDNILPSITYLRYHKMLFLLFMPSSGPGQVKAR